ncbi:MAG: hypothetical protein LOY00_02370 [Methylocaldum sp.]|nr:hypothetical protein [Methylocaldum sp.]
MNRHADPNFPLPVTTRRGVSAFGGGALIVTLGGLIGLGGAEFRLPLLIGTFQFPALDAVIVNKFVSLALSVIKMWRAG